MRWVAWGMLLAALPTHGFAARLYQRETQRVGAWRTAIVRNSFTGEVQCRLTARNRKIVYVADALGFRFPRHWDTTDAAFRIDDEPAYRWRDQLPTLARLQVSIGGRSLDVPTDGIVWLPAAMLLRASSIAIQPGPGKAPRRFDLRGFAAAREAARARGCDPDLRFVR